MTESNSPDIVAAAYQSEDDYNLESLTKDQGQLYLAAVVTKRLKSLDGNVVQQLLHEVALGLGAATESYAKLKVGMNELHDTLIACKRQQQPKSKHNDSRSLQGVIDSRAELYKNIGKLGKRGQDRTIGKMERSVTKVQVLVFC
ncbi:hypothetical protein PS15m_008936 [Mucor circinelloides]